jgi:hypothetical protein
MAQRKFFQFGYWLSILIQFLLKTKRARKYRALFLIIIQSFFFSLEIVLLNNKI